MPNASTNSALESFSHIIERNRVSGKGGIYSVCSAHPQVVEAAIQQALEDGTTLLVESTSSQVNQFGGYTGLMPQDFADYIRSEAKKAGLATDRILLGGDHLGPYPWRTEPHANALEKGKELVRQCVLAGYPKIHLDASMACADDPRVITDETVAERAAELCVAAEKAVQQRGPDATEPRYVIGTEVPVPGGESGESEAPQPTSPSHVFQTLETFQKAFKTRGLERAWGRVIGLVVQSGAEFGDTHVFDYDPAKTRELRQNLPQSPPLVYEGHSTDYQRPGALKNMVEDHFAILKVGPWLTFAYREAIFALSAMERDYLGRRASVQCSRVREVLRSAMLRSPIYWKGYYADADEAAQAFGREFSYSDRCRYYWPDAAVQREIKLLLHNLSQARIPQTLISQYFPDQYDRMRAGEWGAEPNALLEHHIRRVLRIYSAACRA